MRQGNLNSGGINEIYNVFFSFWQVPTLFLYADPKNEHYVFV